MEDLVGLDDIKQQIQKIINIAQSMTKKKKDGQSVPKVNLHTIIIGNTGTSKSKIGEILCRVFYKYGITAKEDAVMVDAVDYSKFAKDFETNYGKAKGGILFIDNVQKLLPAGYSSEINPLDKLFTEMDKSGYDPIVMLAGLPKGLNEYLNENPSAKSKFKYIFQIPDFNPDEMFQIAEKELMKQKFNLNPDAEKQLKRLFKYLVKTKDTSFSNARLVLKIVDDIISNYYQRISEGANDDNIIIPADIKGKIPEEKSIEDIIKEVDSLIGMEDIKRDIRDLFSSIRIEEDRSKIIGSTSKPAIHIVITGNPGTGKTTIVSKLGELFQAIGLLDRGQVIGAERKDLVAGYVGQTAGKTNDKINEAMGGILFIDEAYTLAPEGVNDSFGKEAIDTLLTRMENDRGKFIVVAAGYPKEMDNFINANPGLKSRFNRQFHLNDYNADEMLAIFKKMAESDKYKVEDKAEDKLKDIFSAMYLRRDKNFANGREVRNIFDECKKLLSKRLVEKVNYEKEELLLIKAEDIPKTYEKDKKVTVEEALKTLDNLIGLNTVKQEVKNLINYITVEKERVADGGKGTVLNLHFVFKGNPGTGKTTVARILADIFKAMGLLSRGQLIEVDRSGLVAEYVGQTAPKTNRVIDNAIGGVLFIDEAYTLTPKSDGTDFGEEAIDILLKRMEDDRGKFIVIAAGYSEEMDDFISANPGLPSRFTKYINFEDYTPQELKAIFISMARSKGMGLTPDTDTFLDSVFLKMHENRDKKFANGRTVRNLFETVIQNQAARIAELMQKEKISSEIRDTIQRDDFKSINT
ncbi:MAG: AAA family ATPase [Deltaproteobacteria bacterium]|nr:AAA family ATPase [Deltaproteobacteria bacterium]